MGGFVPPPPHTHTHTHMEGQVQGDKALMGERETHEGGIDLMGGPKFNRLYQKLKVLLLLLILLW